MEVKIWVLIGVVGGMSTVLGFILKVFSSQAIHRLDSIVEELKALREITIGQQFHIQGLQEENRAITTRLNNHAERIRELEINQKPKHVET